MIHNAVRALVRRPAPADADASADRIAALDRAFAERAESHRPASWPTHRTQTKPALDATDTVHEQGPIGRRRGPDRSPTIDFGRYAGWSITMIARRDPDYLDWLARSPIGRTWRPAILEVLRARPKSA